MSEPNTRNCTFKVSEGYTVNALQVFSVGPVKALGSPPYDKSSHFVEMTGKTKTVFNFMIQSAYNTVSSLDYATQELATVDRELLLLMIEGRA